MNKLSITLQKVFSKSTQKTTLTVQFCRSNAFYETIRDYLFPRYDKLNMIGYENQNHTMTINYQMLWVNYNMLKMVMNKTSFFNFLLTNLLWFKLCMCLLHKVKDIRKKNSKNNLVLTSINF